ncbi:HAD family hydrolase [Catenulispora yoronensis]
MPRAGLVIFDLDGTLVDSEPNYLAAEQRLLAEFGVLGFDARAKRPYVGMSTTEMLADLTVRYGLGEPVERLAARKDEYYIDLARAHTPVFEPMRHFVAALSAHGLPLAVASGSTPTAIDAVLQATTLRGYFSVVVSSDAVKHGKPAPDLFLEAAAQAGAHPDHCVVVEDSHYGREAARRAAMRCVFVPGNADQQRRPVNTNTELVFQEGMAGFDPERALDWVLSRIW